MTSSKDNHWVNTRAAMKIFIENFNCCKCKTLAHEPIRYQKCGHLFCAACSGTKSECPTCQTPAKRNEVYSDIIVSEVITHSKRIFDLIKQSDSPIKRDEEAQSSNCSLQKHDTSMRLQNVPKDINKANRKGETLLHIACVKPNIDTVRSLLEAGANPNTKDHSNWLPLHEAASFGYYEICELLLEAGAVPDTPGKDNRTALHEAVIINDLREIKLLRQYNADVNARDRFGCMPFDYAKSEEAREILLDDKLAETIFEKTLANASTVTRLSSNNFSGNGTYILGLNLSSESRQLLDLMAKKHKVKIAKTFGPAVTHVVSDHHITPLSYEILLAILHGKWMLTSQWIRYCLSLADLGIMELDLFEVQGTTDAPRSNTPARARENAQKQNPKLFNGCSFFFAMNNQSSYSYGQLEFTKSMLSKLITEGEGTVLNREPDPELIQTYKEIPFHVSRDLTHPLHRCSHYIIYVPGHDEPVIKYKMPHVKSLPLIWLIESIEQFELLDPAYLEASD